MKSVFFDDNGLLSIDEAIVASGSFQKIMEDGIITEQEVAEQSNVVLSLLQQVQKTFNDQQQELVKQLLVESNVLQAIFHYYQLQTLK